MVYANDQWVQLPVKDVYDSLIMAMAINAAKDMYDKGLEEMKELNKAYGDFMTQVPGDQERYNAAILDPIRNTVNAIYEAGGDPLRNPQARAMISRAINSVPIKTAQLLRLRAENAKEYYKNMAALKMNDKYDEEFSKFLGEDPSQWGENYAGVTSPTASKTLKESTESWYNNRSLRELNQADVESFGIKYDPRRRYTGWTQQDALDVASNNAPGWIGTPYANYARYKAEQQLALTGKPYTREDVEKQLYKNIAQANKEWIAAPTSKADEFALQNQSFRNQLALLKDQLAFTSEQQRRAAQDKLDQIRARYGYRDNGKPGSNGYDLVNAIHHDFLFQGLRNNGIPIRELDDKGKPTGKMKNPDDATWEELEYSAKYGDYAYNTNKFISNLTTKLQNPNKIVDEIKGRFGGKITGILLAGILERPFWKDGSVSLSPSELRLLRGPKGISADIQGSKYVISSEDRLNEVAGKLVGYGNIKFYISDVGGSNGIQIREKYNKGRTEIYVLGTVVGEKLNYSSTGTRSGIERKKVTNVWMPLGINSENTVKGTPNFALNAANQSAYGSINARYAKELGLQQKVNSSLLSNIAQYPQILDQYDLEDLLYILNQ